MSAAFAPGLLVVCAAIGALLLSRTFCWLSRVAGALLIGSAALLWSHPAWADQQITAGNSAQVDCQASARDLTRQDLTAARLLEINPDMLVGGAARANAAQTERSDAEGGPPLRSPDPRLFRAFGVERVPTFVAVSSGFDLCAGFSCRTSLPPFDRLEGNVTVDYALTAFAGADGPAARIAAVALKRLQGNSQP